MAIRFRLKPNGEIDTVEVDSIAEAIAYQAEMAARNGSRKSNPLTSVFDEVAGLSGAATKTSLDPLPEAALKLAKLLYAKPDGLDTAEVAAALGVEPKGVGGSVTSLSHWGKKYDLTKKYLVVKSRKKDGAGRSVRRMTLGHRLRRMIDEGKVVLKDV